MQSWVTGAIIGSSLVISAIIVVSNVNKPVVSHAIDSLTLISGDAVTVDYGTRIQIHDAYVVVTHFDRPQMIIPIGQIRHISIISEAEFAAPARQVI